MHQYHYQVFKEIQNKQNVFLLNGPSITGLQDKIHSLKEKDIIYWGVNNVEGIENNILSRIDKNISIYYIESLEECTARIDDIMEFLERDDSKLLITGVNFIHNTPALKCYLPKNSHKILIVEEFVKTSNMIRNSFGSMLNLFFNIVYFSKNIKPVFVFGMDGLSNQNIPNHDTHAFMETYRNKLPRDNIQIQHFGKLKSHKQTIYEDMACFDKKTMPYFKERNKRVFLNREFKIYNANEGSFYKSLPKISQKKAIDLILGNINQGCEQIQYYKPSLKESFDIYNKIIDFVSNYNISERLYYENSIQIKNTHELLLANKRAKYGVKKARVWLKKIFS